MLSDKERYAAHLKLAEIGEQGQQRLKESSVSVVGVGGLGCNVLTQLSLLGIGRISIIDDDVVQVSNLQRQLLFSEEDIGRYKTEVAQEKIRTMNSSISISQHCSRLDSENRNELLRGSDIVIDCTDNLAGRIIIDKFCSDKQVPMIYGGVRGFEGQVSVFNYGNGNSFAETFPSHETILQSENCDDSGVIASVVSITASLQVSETLKIILKKPNVLQGKMQVFHLLTNSFRVVNLK